MTFIPLLGYYLLRPKAEPSIQERRQRGFAAAYYRVGRAAIEHRWAFLAGSLVLLVLGGAFMSQLKTQFFPQDLQYLSYVDVWLPEDAPIAATNRVAGEVETTIRRVADEYAKTHSEDPNQARQVLKSLTTFVGGGGPRFWFSAAPELGQPNYAQVIIEVVEKHDTEHLVDAIQAELDATIPGVRIDVRRLEVGPPVGIPVSIRVSGEDIGTLRQLAGEVAGILRDIPTAARVRDNWGPESFAVRLRTDSDKANLSGLTNLDVAAASATAMTGVPGGNPARRRGADSRRGSLANGRARAAVRHPKPLRLRQARNAESAAAVHLVDRLRHADRKAPATESVPHDHDLGIPRGARAAV